MFVIYALVLVLVLVKICMNLSNTECTAHTCLNGKVAVVTGGNSGLGLQTVLNFASRGCKVIIADVTNGEAIVTKVKEESGNPNIHWKYIDLGCLESVRDFAAGILKTETKLDLLINNAGCGGALGYTKDGLQKNMQINYFGHFLLTHLLIDLLKKSEDPRIINVSSVLAFTHNISTVEEINIEKAFFFNLITPWIQYSNSKLCVLIATKIMAEKLSKQRIRCYSVHPGAIHTQIVNSSAENLKMTIFGKAFFKCLSTIFMFFFGKTAREGAQTTIYCALTKNIEHLSGKYFWNGRVFLEPPIAYKRDFCLQVWNESEKLVKLRNEEKLL